MFDSNLSSHYFFANTGTENCDFTAFPCATEQISATTCPYRDNWAKDSCFKIGYTAACVCGGGYSKIDATRISIPTLVCKGMSADQCHALFDNDTFCAPDVAIPSNLCQTGECCAAISPVCLRSTFIMTTVLILILSQHRNSRVRHMDAPEWMMRACIMVARIGQCISHRFHTRIFIGRPSIFCALWIS